MNEQFKKMACPLKLKASRDALEVINGKWRIPIVISLSYGNKRFGEIQNDISDISPKMLAQELKVLEMNQLIKRTVYDKTPVIIEYALTPLGKSLFSLLDELLIWGSLFRKKILNRR